MGGVVSGARLWSSFCGSVSESDFGEAYVVFHLGKTGQETG